MMKKALLLTIGMILSLLIWGQQQDFTRRDSLKGSITPEREWWDLKYYHLDVEVKPEDKSLEGSVLIEYEVINAPSMLQVDLQKPLIIRKIEDEEGKPLLFKSEGNAHFVALRKAQNIGERHWIKVFYGGVPKEAVRPPWDGGVTWVKDDNGKDMIHTSCQGIGASVWWPNKDHPYDEPDSMLISVKAPKGLMNVSNGRLRRIEKMGDGSNKYHWFVSNPINNYGVNINVGDYVHFSEKYPGEKGELTLDYYVLPYNLEKAKEQFMDALKMMEAFEHWFGPYPFYEDGFKLVEVSYLGMEHQSSVTYGNNYINGYRGTDLSSTGWGLKFDFIIIHEAGHEWFANNITYRDAADMWIHESFTNYSESLFLEYHWDISAGQEYVRGTRARIQNDKPIIGPYGVDARGSGDMYYKGGNMLNTIRSIIDNDDTWREILRGLNKEFYHQTVSTSQVEEYISAKSGIDLSKVFDQYLRDFRVPSLEYYIEDGNLFFRWGQVVPGFNMPLDILLEGSESLRINPVPGKWNTIPYQVTEIKPDLDFYISILRIR